MAEKQPRKGGIRALNNVQSLYSWIRAAILSGQMGAGQSINQASLAAELGVSRTPIREALRMLQAEGLITGEMNQRMRVTTLNAEDIDSLAATRILLECMALAVTIPRLTKQDIERIQAAFQHMNAQAWLNDRSAWEAYHNEFHGLLIMHAGAVGGHIMPETISGLQLRAERFRRYYVSHDPQASAVAADDHRKIVDAISRRSLGEAVHLLSHHYARTALSLLAMLAPQYQPTALSSALNFVNGGEADLSAPNLLAMVRA